MEALLQQIENYKQEIAAYEAGTADAAETFRIKYLGTKGIVKAIMGEMKNVPGEKKKEFGLLLNEFKQFAEAKYDTLKGSAADSQQPTEKNFDWTLPGDPFPVGSRHPISIVRNEIVSILNVLVLQLPKARK